VSIRIDDGLPTEQLSALIEKVSAVATDEVVTRALSRDVVLPHNPGKTAVLITLSNGFDHTRPNTLGPRSLGELNAAPAKR